MNSNRNIPTIQSIAGQRCLVSRADPSKLQQRQTKRPPMIVCIGMAQVLEHWQHQILPLSQQYTRDVLIYQPIGLGQSNDSNDDFSNVTLPYQAEQLVNVIQEAFFSTSSSLNDKESEEETDQQNNGNRKIVLVGYSLGGRIIMALLVLLLQQQQQENLTENQVMSSSLLTIQNIRKVHLTGVGMSRSDYGAIQFQMWKDHLQHDNIRAFAWSILTASYSPSYLKRQLVPIIATTSTVATSRLHLWIDSLCASHTREGLLAILEQTHHDDDAADNESSSVWSVRTMAQHINTIPVANHDDSNDNHNFKGHLVVGEYDVLSPLDQVQLLCDQLNHPNNHPKWTFERIPHCGHAAPMESSRQWQRSVLEFLKK